MNHSQAATPLTNTDRRLRHARPPHDLDGAMTLGRGQHDLGPPDELAWRVAVDDQGPKFGAVGGAKIKADVGASHPPTMPQQAAHGNLVSGWEH